MLTIRDCTIKTIKNRILIDHLSFTCLEHEKIAVIGEEGNGKSTLLKAILNQDLISGFTVIQGEIITNHANIGYLPQNLEAEWNEISGLDFLLSDAPQSDADYENIGAIYPVMDRLHVSLDLLDRKMCVLSGGEKVKLQLVKLSLCESEILLLDEPTNDLDLDTLCLLENFIQTSEAAVLFVSHDETLLENCAQGILHLEQIKRKTEARNALYHCGYKEYLQRRFAMAQRQDQLSIKEQEEYNKQQERYRKLYQSVDHALNSCSRQSPHEAKMLKRKMKSVKSFGKRLENKEITHKFEGEDQIQLHFDSGVRVNRRKKIVDYDLDVLKVEDQRLAQGIHLEVYGSEKIAIVGKNGCGKTTLLRILWNELEHRMDLRVGYMPQNYEDQMPQELNILDYLEPSLEKEKRTIIQNHLGSLKFTPDEMQRPIRNCSSGQKAKLLLLKLVLEKYDVLLLDEPTRNLSPLSARLIREQLANFGGAIISVSHDRKYLQEVCDTLYQLDLEGLKEVEF